MDNSFSCNELRPLVISTRVSTRHVYQGAATCNFYFVLCTFLMPALPFLAFTVCPDFEEEIQLPPFATGFICFKNNHEIKFQIKQMTLAIICLLFHNANQGKEQEERERSGEG